MYIKLETDTIYNESGEKIYLFIGSKKKKGKRVMPGESITLPSKVKIGVYTTGNTDIMASRDEK